MRRLGDRDSNLSSFVENIICQHLEKYGEDIEKMEKAVSRKKRVDGFLEKVVSWTFQYASTRSRFYK